VQRLVTSSEHRLNQLLETAVNPVLEAAGDRPPQTTPYERISERQGYRDGYKLWQLP